MNAAVKSDSPSSSSTLSLSKDPFSVQHTIFTYEKDETLIFYSKQSSFLVSALLPKNQTQALHPLPYELSNDASETEKTSNWKEQIYVAAWNGLVLGYPRYFVERYCEEFHNSLPKEEKEKEIRNAENDFIHFQEKYNYYHSSKHFQKLTSPEIQFGFNNPIAKSHLKELIEVINQFL
jgi:hypothetical protein